jgi:hypothetical protein
MFIALVAAALLSCRKHSSEMAASAKPVGQASQTETSSVRPQRQTHREPADTDPFKTSIPERFIGTYLPSVYIESLHTSKSHIVALRATNKAGVYSVLSLSSEYIHTDDHFYDQRALKPDVFSHNWSNEESSTITDTRGNIYHKISSDPSYGTELDKYYFRELLDSRTYNDSKGNTLVIGSNGLLQLNGDLFTLDGVGLRGKDDTIDLIFCTKQHLLYGIEARDSTVRIYRVAFKENTAPLRDLIESELVEVYVFIQGE